MDKSGESTPATNGSLILKTVNPSHPSFFVLRATSIRETLTTQLANPQPAPQVHFDFSPIGQAIDTLRADLTKAAAKSKSGESKTAATPKLRSVLHELEMMHSTLATLKDLAAAQRDHLDGARKLLDERARQGNVEIEVTQELLANESAFLEHFHEALAKAREGKK